jgi:hypothetical protein
MPILPRLTRRCLLLGGFPLVASALVAVPFLTAPGPLDAARAKYDRIQAGMTQDEVREILGDRWPDLGAGSLHWWRSRWYDQRSGATITVVFGYDNTVTDKDFDEGDQSFRAKVGRLKNFLADRLHRGP